MGEIATQKLAEIYLSDLLMGHARMPYVEQEVPTPRRPFTVGAATLEPDKRRRRVVISECLNLGYIEKPDMSIGETAAMYATFDIREKLWHDYLSVEPKLVFDPADIPTMEDSSRGLGALWDGLSLPERKFVWDNHGRFVFHASSHYGGQVVLLERGLLPPCWDHYNHKARGKWSLYVSTPEYQEARAAHIFELRVQAMMRRNLPWYMTDVLNMPEIDADVFSQRDDKLHLFEQSRYFGPDPSKWETELEAGIEKVRDSIAKLTRQGNILLAARVKLLERFKGQESSWAKDYEDRLRRTLKSLKVKD